MDEKKNFPPLVEEKETLSPKVREVLEEKLNTQRNSFQITINNPLAEGLDHKKIKEILTLNFSTLTYFCLADEIAETGTPHTHI